MIIAVTIGKKRWVDFRLKLSVAEITFELGAVPFVLKEKEAAEANAATDLYFLKQRRWDCLGFYLALCGYFWAGAFSATRLAARPEHEGVFALNPLCPGRRRGGALGPPEAGAAIRYAVQPEACHLADAGWSARIPERELASCIQMLRGWTSTLRAAVTATSRCARSSGI